MAAEGLGPNTGFVAGATGDSQHSVDTKAFKGKGGLPQLVAAQKAVNSVHSEMEFLVATTRQVPDKRFVLCLHRRPDTNQVSVRWRSGGSINGHLSWDAFEERLTELPVFMADWYRRTDQLARELNDQEKTARSQLRAVLRAQQREAMRAAKQKSLRKVRK